MLPSDQTGLFIPLTLNPSPRGEREIKKHDFFIKENCLITDETIEQKPGEDSPIGLILCPGKSEEQITLLHLVLSHFVWVDQIFAKVSFPATK